MPELTPEEKQKIYLEEKERLEAQTRLTNEKKALELAKKQKATKNSAIGCSVVLILILSIYLCSVFSPSKKQSTPELNANVRYSGTQIIIKNNDSFSWDNIKIELNAGLLDSGYYYEGGSIAAGATATIGILNFAKSSGERLNPLSIKVRTATVGADTPSGRAYYSGKWD